VVILALGMAAGVGLSRAHVERERGWERGDLAGKFFLFFLRGMGMAPIQLSPPLSFLS
jgi:hypothetical protein